MKILSIDAWRDNGNWSWNNWHQVGTIGKAEFESLKTNRQIIKWFRDNDYISDSSKGRVTIDDDDQHNIVLCDKNTGEPIFAIEYGPEY